MKKTMCIFVLACVVMGAVFAQQKPATPAPAAPAPADPAPADTAEASRERKNSVSLDLFQLFRGFITSDSDIDFSVFIFSSAYERLIAPHFSLGADMDVYSLGFGKGINGTYICVAAEGRYYPQSENFEKFFLGTTLGYNQLSIDGSSKRENGGFSGLTVSLKTGYKLITAKNLYLEPSLSYVLSKSSVMSRLAGAFGMSMPDIPTPLGWNGGLRLGYVF